MAANGVYYSQSQGLLLSSNETVRVDIATGGTITFNSAYSFPTSDGTNTHVLQTNGNGALSFGLVQNSALQNSSSTITAGDGLTSGGTLTLGGSVTLAVDYSGADNVILAATNQTSTQVTTGSKIMVSDASNNVNYHNVSDLPFTNNVGTVTSVGITAGALIDVSNSPITTSGNITVAVDLSELVTTSDDANLDFLPIINSSNQQFKIAPSNVALSLFNNDAGWTSNVGTVTSVAITGTDGIDVDSGSPITSSGTITLGLSNVPNSSLANSSITFAGDSGSNQIMSLGETFTIEGGGGIETSTGTDKVVVSHYNAGAAPSNLNSNNSNGTVIQDLTMSFDTYGHVTGATVGTANLDTRYLSFRTINVPTGTDPVADAYNDTLNFISSDGSVVISGNSTTDTIDIKVGSGVDTYVTGGTFTSGTLSLGLNDGSSATDITGIWTNIPNTALQNSSVSITAGAGLTDGGSVSLGGSVTVNVGEGTGITVNANDVSLDYLGDDNFIGSATNLVGTPIATTDWIVYHDATDSNVKRGAVSDLPFTNNTGTVTSVAITGTDGIDVDSGSPITTSGTITLGLSNVPNSSLANSSFTLAGDGGVNQTISLGNTLTIEGGQGISTAGAATDKLTVNLDDTTVTANSYGSSSQVATFTVDSQGRLTAASDVTIDGSAISNNNAFTTINVPNGTDPVANAYNDTLNFISSDGSVVISGNSTTDTIDITVGSSVDTYVTGGTFSSGSLTLGRNDGSSASAITGFGTVTSVGITAGNLVDVTGGPVTGSGSITVNVDLSELSTTTDDANLDFLPAINSSNQQFKIAPSNVALSLFNNDQGWTSNAGTVTSVTVGTGLDVTNGTTTPNITLDLSELATSTSDADGDFFVVVDSSNVQRKLTKGNINLSGFNNDAGFTTNTGTVTSVAITGTDGIDVDSGSPITTSGTITLGLSNVPNSSLQNSSITVTAGAGLTGGGTPSLGGSVTVSHADTSSDSGFNSNNSNGVVIQDVTVALDTYGHVTGTTVGTVNLDSRYYTETEADARFLSFRTINVPTGTDPVADAYNDTLNFVSSDSSVVISGNSTTDTIDIKVGSGVNTNIYSDNGTLSGARTLSQGGNRIKFDSSSSESFDVVKTTAATGDNNPRMFIEADNTYGTVLELESPEAATYFLRARNTAGDVLFSVDGEGNLSAQSKSFDIEHPTKDGKRLHYGSLEGPEHGVYVRGRLNGTDTIELPDYWLALVDENSITVQLTPVGSSQPLYVKDIKDNKVIVGNGSVLTNTPINCFYFVQAERKDIEKITVEY